LGRLEDLGHGAHGISVSFLIPYSLYVLSATDAYCFLFIYHSLPCITTHDTTSHSIPILSCSLSLVASRTSFHLSQLGFHRRANIIDSLARIRDTLKCAKRAAQAHRYLNTFNTSVDLIHPVTQQVDLYPTVFVSLLLFLLLLFLPVPRCIRHCNKRTPG
jgi:hypothetical protein